MEFLGEPVDLSAGGAEDNSLGDGDGLVQVTEGVELPVLLLDGDVWLISEALSDSVNGIQN